MFDGKKSYIVAALIAITTFVYAMGWINEGAYVAILGVLGASGIAALRSAIKKEI